MSSEKSLFCVAVNLIIEATDSDEAKNIVNSLPLCYLKDVEGVIYTNSVTPVPENWMDDDTLGV